VGGNRSPSRARAALSSSRHLHAVVVRRRHVAAAGTEAEARATRAAGRCVTRRPICTRLSAHATWRQLRRMQTIASRPVSLPLSLARRLPSTSNITPPVLGLTTACGPICFRTHHIRGTTSATQKCCGCDLSTDPKSTQI